MEQPRGRRRSKTLPGPFEATRKPAPEAAGKKHKKGAGHLTASTEGAVTAFGELETNTESEPTQPEEPKVMLENEPKQELDASDLLIGEEPKTKRTKASPPPAPARASKPEMAPGATQKEHELRQLGDAYASAKEEYQALKKNVKTRVDQAKADLEGRGLEPETMAYSLDVIRRDLNAQLDVASKKMRDARVAYEDQYALWEAGKSKTRIGQMGARVDRAMAEEDEAAKKKNAEELEQRVDARIAKEDETERWETGLKERAAQREENAWFAQGEDPSHVRSLAENQHAEDARSVEDVRRQIAESYGPSEHETVLDTQEAVDAAAKQAEAMLASGELSQAVFNANDYRYLLTEQARLDRALETAGWWEARKLRKELKETRAALADYEQQIQSVHNERANDRKTAAERNAPSESRAAKHILPEGSGTSIYANKKPGFFAKLLGRSK